ncbi:DUF418 domain-containing protein [Bacillus sp. Gen3]|nr:DUF418 domain-containing protein [Heyndrickxia oleronia]NYV67724.1 DUF418 domain-containing protein [Bacillus sp. Gen3]
MFRGTDSQVQPIQSNERISSLDVLRGFSLLGIFLVNMISFESPILYYDPQGWWQGTDKSLFSWIEVLVQSSFYPIFAMLFGYGLVILRERCEQKGISFNKLGVRRLLLLVVIGAIHAFFIWSGDILLNYAIFGLILMLILNWSGKTLIYSGLALFLIPNLLFSLLLMLLAMTSPHDISTYADMAGITDSVKNYGSGTYIEITAQRFHDWYMVNGPENIIFILFSIIPLMMIGAGAAKLKWLQTKIDKKKWLVLLILSAIIGLFLKLLPVVIDSNLAYKFIQQSLGGTILSLAYISLIILLLTNKYFSKLFKPFATAGRMSLTIYLTQSIVGTLIFYHYGLGLYTKLTLGTSMLLAILIYIIQVVLAELWFIKFKYGPVEKVWRLLTYGKAIKSK